MEINDMNESESPELMAEGEDMVPDFSNALQSLGDHLKNITPDEFEEESNDTFDAPNDIESFPDIENEEVVTFDEATPEENEEVIAFDETTDDMIVSFDENTQADEEPIVSFDDTELPPTSTEDIPEATEEQEPPSIDNGGLDLSHLTHLLEELKSECHRVSEMRKSVAKAREMIKELSHALES